MHGFATPMNLVVPDFNGKADRDYAQDNALGYTAFSFWESQGYNLCPTTGRYLNEGLHCGSVGAGGGGAGFDVLVCASIQQGCLAYFRRGQGCEKLVSSL